MADDIDAKIDAFLSQPAFAVAGASTNREKYGNKVVRAYVQNNKHVTPIHPRAEEIEGIPAVPDVGGVRKDTFALSIVTPPKITLDVVRAGLERGIRHFWMQPGAENPEAIKEAEDRGASVIHDGPCVLVALGYHESS